MPNELIGQLIVSVIIALMIGGLGIVQYRSNVAFNVGFVKREMDSKVMAKILGVHLMVSSVVILIMPFVFYQLGGLEHAKTIERVIFCVLIVLLLVSLNFQFNRAVKQKNNE